MNDLDVKILKACVKLYPDDLDGGLSIINRYGFETVDRALMRAYQEKWTHQRLGFRKDGHMHGTMQNCGYDPVNRFPLTDHGCETLKTSKNYLESFWSYFVTWYGILGTTATLVGIWLFGWQVWGWWFFGLSSK